MSDETEVSTDLPEGETVAEKPATQEAPETGTEQAPESQEEESPKPKHKPWFQERIDQLTREKYDEKRRAEALEQTIAEMRAADPDKPKPAPAEVDRLVNEKLAARQFDEKCNEVYSSGTAEFKDFDEVLGNFRMLGGIPQPLLEAVTQLPDAHKVLHALGSNMDEAARIVGLDPVPMAIELAKLSMGGAKSKPVSKAPPPITPIDGIAKGDPDPSKMSMEDWYRWREEQVKTRS